MIRRFIWCVALLGALATPSAAQQTAGSAAAQPVAYAGDGAKLTDARA